MRHASRLLAAVLLLLVCRLPQASGQVAVNYVGNGQITTLPANGGFSPRTGLSLSFNPQWTNNYGYHPLQITIRSLKPATKDRNILLQLRSQSWDSQHGSMAVTQEAVLPQGATQVTMTVDVPSYRQLPWSGGSYYSWDVRVDGTYDKNLSTPQSMGGWFS
jgi:hypothetical protein